MKCSWFILCSLILGTSSVWAEEDIQPDQLTAEQTEFFEAKVRPILTEHCYDCHSNQAKKLKGKLFLDSKWGWATGGVGGPAIIPGDLIESMVIDAVKHTEELVDAMPPKYKIEDEEIAILEKWVLMGAPDPRPKVEPKDGLVEKFDLQKRFQEHWSWRPVENPPIPPTEQKDWGTSPIDQFVLSKIEASGLQPAQPADDRTWIRRIYFDLIGLPPSPAEIAQALQISLTALVDKLLASPRFGEKWARHWMDLMRYADTYGHEFDYAIKNAHEYRDYLIRAFNEDVPYDDFIREHLAGDLIKEPRLHPSDGYNESVIGTGFWYFHDATHGPTDVLQNESDHQDNQIDVMSKAFQGLTISCARCHDHKFDAISTADYYALTGYLNSSAKVDYPLDVGGKRKQTMAKQKELLTSASLQSIKPNDPEKIIQSFIATANFIRKKQQEPPPDPWQGQLIDDFESGTDKWTLAHRDANAPAIATIEVNATSTKGARGTNWFDTRIYNTQEPLTWVSQTLTIEKPYLNFLIGGSLSPHNRLELIVDGKVVLHASPKTEKNLSPISLDASKHVGKNGRLRISWKVPQPLFLDHIVFASRQWNDKRPPEPTAEEISQLARFPDTSLPLINQWIELISKKKNPDHWTPEKFLQDFIKQPQKIQNYNWANRDQNFANYESNSSVFADFSKGILPDGWVNTGLAFQFTENNRLRFDSKRPFIETNSIDSSLYGKKQVGTLRSPTFTIDQNIHMRLNAEKSMVRLVIENYGMAEHSDLLFKGTIYKNDSRQTNSLTGFKWIQFDPASIKKYAGKRAYLEFIDNGDGYAQVEQVRFSNAPLPHSFHPLVRCLTESGTPKSIEDTGSLLGQAWQSGDPEILNWFFHRGLADSSILKPEVNQLVSSGEKLAQKMPAARFALTMSQTTPENARVYVRGSYKSLGEEVPHRYIEALGAKQADRLGLANIIASQENPLTSRVMVNRIWLHLFGRGIVPTPDDFGPMGQLPSHPELLDWLASDFAQNGWSIKRTIRSIVLSQTYGQAAQANPQLSAEKISQIDPDNILLHRMPVRRLQAEAIRDSLLAVSGRINLHAFGPGVPTHRTAFMTGRGSRPSGPLDGNGRRSVYQAIYRNFLNPFLLAFDMPSPFGPKGRRGNSNVPAQSLTLMNDPLVSKLAHSWAQKTANQKDSRKRIEQMVEHAHGKIPSKETTDQLLAFVELQGKEYGKVDQRAWADLAHTLFNLKDFSYLQ
jgi:cytochrome c553